MKIVEALLSHHILVSLVLWTVLAFCWGILLAAWRYVPSAATFARRSMDAADTASSMRLGFLMTIGCCSVSTLIGVCMRFDCTAFWTCLGGTFTAAFAAKGWQRATELSKEVPTA